MNAKTARPSLVSLEIYADASGAPALIQIGGFRFSCDLLGEIKLNLVGGPSGRTENRIAADRARAFYRATLDEKTTAEWRAANAALYA